MIIETLKTIYARDLNELKNEIEAYKNEENLWRFESGILNSAGNLCLHILGNLNAYVGVGLAETGYVRQRDLEFSQKNISKTELIQKIEAAIEMMETALNNLSPEQLKDDFPVIIWKEPTEMEYTLVHLTTHLNWHLGQISYHRRFFDR
jgi:hypothetical protein